jgi:hypothetical protein
MMPEEIDPADLAALEQLVRYGLADVVTIDGEPHYALGQLFVGAPKRRRELSRSPRLKTAWRLDGRAPSAPVP